MAPNKEADHLSPGRSASQMSDPVDSRMMQRCLALAMEAADRGEQPYAAVVCRAGQLVCEAISSVRYDRDVTRHAELVAISNAFRRLNRTSLEDCTIYSNAEPCALCCYAMREKPHRTRGLQHSGAAYRRRVAVEDSR